MGSSSSKSMLKAQDTRRSKSSEVSRPTKVECEAKPSTVTRRRASIDAVCNSAVGNQEVFHYNEISKDLRSSETNIKLADDNGSEEIVVVSGYIKGRRSSLSLNPVDGTQTASEATNQYQASEKNVVEVSNRRRSFVKTVDTSMIIEKGDDGVAKYNFEKTFEHTAHQVNWQEYFSQQPAATN